MEEMAVRNRHTPTVVDIYCPLCEVAGGEGKRKEEGREERGRIWRGKRKKVRRKSELTNRKLDRFRTDTILYLEMRKCLSASAYNLYHQIW